MGDNRIEFDFKTVINSAADTMLLVDKDGLIRFANGQIEKDFGYTVEEAINMKIEMLIPHRFRIPHVAYREEYAKKAVPRHMGVLDNIVGLRKNGEEFPADVSINPVHTKEGEVFYTAAVRDITEKKAILRELIQAKEKAEESSRLKSAFLATISHELRTPLNQIHGFSDLINEMAEDESIKEFSSQIHESSINLINIISDIFQLAFYDRSDITIRENEVVVKDLFGELKTELRALLQEAEKGSEIELAFDLDSRIAGRAIVTDKSKVRQAMSHMMKNAIKFTTEGKIELNVELIENETLLFSLKDSGIGIPQDHIDTVFEPFLQVDDTYTRTYGGTGIGLSISKRIVEAMNGEIRVESIEGVGSMFSLYLPVRFVD